MNYGLKLKPIEPDHYVFGDAKLGDAPILTDGQWTQWLPVPEDQNIGLEPMACTTFALLNAVEIMLRQKYGATDNLSDKFLAYASGTTREGNDPHTVAEALRTKGDVYEADYPYTKADNTWEKFYATPPQYLYVKALEFVAQYNFGHSWVSPISQQAMMDALNYSPLTAGVYAWEQDAVTGYYTNKQNLSPEHDVCIYGYERNNYWKVFDSYANEVKKLAWDFPFVAVKRYTLNRQVVNPSAWQKFLDWMNDILEGMKAKLGLGDYAPFGGVARSSQWPKVRNDFLKSHPTCAVCGGTKNLNVHHKRPYHLHPEDELNPQNLITLCNHGLHHLWLGHLGNFQSYNVDVETDSANLLTKIKNRP